MQLPRWSPVGVARQASFEAHCLRLVTNSPGVARPSLEPPWELRRLVTGAAKAKARARPSPDSATRKEAPLRGANRGFAVSCGAVSRRLNGKRERVCRRRGETQPDGPFVPAERSPQTWRRRPRGFVGTSSAFLKFESYRAPGVRVIANRGNRSDMIVFIESMN